MIRIYRGEESDALAASREKHLASARLRGAAPTTFEGYRTDVEALLDRQYDKCAYCEIDVRGEAMPVEHVRPKSEVTRVDWSGLGALKSATAETEYDDAQFARGLPPVERERLEWTAPAPCYWWLAWTWENHLLACTGCNTGLKTTRFPLRRGSPVMTEHEQLPGAEEALLLDPMRDDPMEHIVFEYDGTSHWKAFPRKGSASGAWTIFVLHLNSDGLLGKYGRRVRDLERWAGPLARAVSARRAASVCKGEWESLRDHVLAPDQPFLALTHDWLDAKWDAATRARWGVVLDRPSLCLPGTPRTPTVRPPLPARPELAGVPETLALELRAQRHLVNLTQERRSVIGKLIALSPPRTDDEIAAMVGCDSADVLRCRTGR